MRSYYIHISEHRHYCRCDIAGVEDVIDTARKHKNEMSTSIQGQDVQNFESCQFPLCNMSCILLRQKKFT